MSVSKTNVPDPSRMNALIAVTLAQLMSIMSLTVSSTGLPTIGAELDVELSKAGWVVTSFLLGLAATVLIAGRLGDIYGYRRVFAVGLVQFTLAGFLVGISPEIITLITARLFQGIGTALMLGTGYAIVSEVFKINRRGLAIGVLFAGATSGGLVGVAMTPVILEFLDWHWALILSSVPLGLIASYFTARMGLEDRNPRRGTGRQIDVRGAILFAAFMTATLLSFSHIHEGEETFQDGWQYHILMQVIAGILLAIFIWVEKRTADPLIQLNLLRHKVFGSAVFANGVLHMTMMTILFIIPFLVENGLERSGPYTSIMLIIFEILSAPASLFSGWLYDKTQSPLIRPVSLIIMACSFVGIGLLATLGSYWLLVGVLVVLGTSAGIFLTPATATVMSALPYEHQGFASGMVETSRHLGHSLGAAIAVGIMGFSVVGSLSDASGQPGAFLEAFRNVCVVVGIIAAIGVLPSSVNARRPYEAPRTA